MQGLETNPDSAVDAFCREMLGTGTSLAESDKLGRSIEELLLKVPEVVATARRTGRAELDEHVQGVESAELDVLG